MKPNLPTVYRRKDLESSVKKTRKSAVIKTSVILNRLLEELKVTHNTKSIADVLLDVINDVVEGEQKVDTVSCRITSPMCRT